MQNFLQKSFHERRDSTVGVDFQVKYMKVDGVKVKATFWDTAGQERYRTALAPIMYKEAHGIMFVYDCTDRDTFENLTFWRDAVQDNAVKENRVSMVVRNKIDLPGARVSSEEGQEFATRSSMEYMETSAKSGLGVQMAFEELVRKILYVPDLTTPPGPYGRMLLEPPRPGWFRCRRCQHRRRQESRRLLQ
jgi:Ras-related protein Rab-18